LFGEHPEPAYDDAPFGRSVYLDVVQNIFVYQ
jgi:hypothetical protein